jgi:hypothetical protein
MAGLTKREEGAAMEKIAVSAMWFGVIADRG